MDFQGWCLFWAPSVWSWFIVHGQSFLGIVTWILFSSILHKCSLHALCLLLVFTSLPLLLVREEKQSQASMLSGRAITAYQRGLNAHLVVSSETFWSSSSWRSCPSVTPISVFDHFDYFWHPPVSPTLHSSRLSVGGHHKMKNKSMEQWWRGRRMISTYTFFSWDVPFQNGEQGV